MVKNLKNVTLQKDKLGVIVSSVTPKSFEPGNAIIRAGQVEICKTSPYLQSAIPSGAKAELLIAPQPLEKIDGQDLGTLLDTIERIREIKNGSCLAESFLAA